MRKVLIIATIFFAGLSGCKKSSNSGSFMNATINGVSFSRNNCVAKIDTVPISLNIALNIFGANYNPNAVPTLYAPPLIHFGIINFKGVGIYPMTDTLTTPSTISAGGGNYESSYAAPLSIAVYGIINITSTTPDIAGTFSFTCADSTKVTNGIFSAKAP